MEREVAAWKMVGQLPKQQQQAGSWGHKVVSATEFVGDACD